MDLAIIIVSYNTRELTKQCLDSLFAHKILPEFEVWVVDNASTDGSVDMLQKYSDINLIIEDSNLGFAKANNLAIKRAKAQYYLLLNSDTIVAENSINKLYTSAVDQGFGISACKLLYTDMTFQPNGGDLPKFIPLMTWLTGLDDLARLIGVRLPSFHFSSQQQFNTRIGWVAGTAMLVKSEVIEKIGVLDEKLFMYVEDVDYCWRAANKNFRIGWVADTSIIHIGGGSSKNPRISQWRGEFKGLTYMYNKYYGRGAAILLRFLIIIFGLLRMLGFGVMGKWDYVKAYGKVIISF